MLQCLQYSVSAREPCLLSRYQISQHNLWPALTSLWLRITDLIFSGFFLEKWITLVDTEQLQVAAMVFYRSKYYQPYLVRLLALILVTVVLYQTFLIQNFKKLLLARELERNKSKIGRKWINQCNIPLNISTIKQATTEHFLLQESQPSLTTAVRGRSTTVPATPSSS